MADYDYFKDTAPDFKNTAPDGTTPPVVETSNAVETQVEQPTVVETRDGVAAEEGQGVSTEGVTRELGDAQLMLADLDRQIESLKALGVATDAIAGLEMARNAVAEKITQTSTSISSLPPTADATSVAATTAQSAQQAATDAKQEVTRAQNDAKQAEGEVIQREVSGMLLAAAVAPAMVSVGAGGVISTPGAMLMGAGSLVDVMNKMQKVDPEQVVNDGRFLRDRLEMIDPQTNTVKLAEVAGGAVSLGERVAQAGPAKQRQTGVDAGMSA